MNQSNTELLPCRDDGELHPELAKATAKTALQFLSTFNPKNDGDKPIDWHSDTPWPNRRDLAVALDHLQDLAAMTLNLAGRVGAELAQSDEAHVALWRAIEAITLGNKTDDKLILKNLRAAGYWICRTTPAPEAAEQPAGEGMTDAEAYIRAKIHYPECWDTMAYPTLVSALWEGWGAHACTNDECAHLTSKREQPAVAQELPELPSNLLNVLRRIRRCESIAPAQVVFEHFVRAYAQQAVAQQEDVWVRRCNATARERDQHQARAENYTRALATAQENGFETVSDAISQAIILRGELTALREQAVRDRQDAECFRFWVSEAARNPTNMARLIMNCITEDQYREAIMPCVTGAKAIIDAAIAKEQK